jgi:hypothetical protein
MARSMIVHARLPDSFLYHAIRYASAVFNILPVKGLINKDGKSATPAEIFYGPKPCIGDFRVFGCPCVLKKWITHFDGKVLTKQTERGIRGIFIGFANNQKGFLVDLLSTRRITISADVLFDESFQTAIVTNWCQYQDSLAQQPELSFIPTLTPPWNQLAALKTAQNQLKRGILKRGIVRIYTLFKYG